MVDSLSSSRLSPRRHLFLWGVDTMFGKNVVSDKELSKTVNTRLARAGAGSRITAVVNRGVATLLGKLQYAAQRTPIMNTASRVAGVRQVIDQMQLIPPKKILPTPKPVVKPAPPVEKIEEVPPPDTSPAQQGESVLEK
jgi:hypothetical protein